MALALAGPSGAQQPVQGLVLSPSGEPMAAAVVSFHPDPPAAPDCLRTWLPASPPTQTSTDGSGRYRIDTGSRGCLVVSHAAGLGALLWDASPGVPDRVQLQPLGEILIGATADTRAFVAVTSPEDIPRFLGQRQGPTLRLPPGRYSVLVDRAGVWEEHVCQLFGSQRIELPSRSQPRLVPTHDGFRGRILTAAIPEIVLSEGSDLQLSASAPPLVLRVAHDQGQMISYSEVWVPPTEESVEVRPQELRTAELRVRSSRAEALEAARVFTLQPTARGPVVRAGAAVDGEGRGRRAVLDGEARVLVYAPGQAPRILGGAELELDEVTLEEGFDVVVEVDGAGPETAGLTLVLEHGSNPWLVYTARTDRRGTARFSDLPAGRAVVKLSSPDFVPQQRQVAIPGPALVLPARRGQQLDGRVVRPDGEPARGATVLLRDTTGTIRSQRRAFTDAEGRFSFPGIGTESVFTLSAEMQRAGKTWSAQQRGVQAGQGEWRLQLRLEDPTPPHRRDG